MRRVVLRRAREAEGSPPPRHDFRGVDAFACHGSKQMMRVVTGIRHDLRRFEPVADTDRQGRLERCAEVAKEGKSGKLSAVSDNIVDVPCRLCRMPVTCGQCRLNEGMRAADPAIEKGDIIRIETGLERGPPHQICDPVVLLLDRHRVEIVCRAGGRRESADPAEVSDGCRQFHRSRDRDHHQILREFQPI